jgi:hypothetical protein
MSTTATAPESIPAYVPHLSIVIPVSQAHPPCLVPGAAMTTIARAKMATNIVSVDQAGSYGSDQSFGGTSSRTTTSAKSSLAAG